MGTTSPDLQGFPGSGDALWVMGEGHRKEGCLEVSSDTILLGSQRNLKGLLSWQTRAIKLHSLQKSIQEWWRGSSELDVRGRQRESHRLHS